MSKGLILWLDEGSILFLNLIQEILGGSVMIFGMQQAARSSSNLFYKILIPCILEVLGRVQHIYPN